MIAGFAYAQARAQAHFAALPEEPVWQGLEAARTLSAYLEEARRTPLAEWISGLSLASDNHHVERQLQRGMHDRVTDAAGWVPAAWRPAVLWTAWLPELQALERLLHNQALPPNNSPGPLLAPLLDSAAGGPAAALVRAGAAALLPDPRLPRISARWLREWRRLWPPAPAGAREGLERLSRLVQRHQARFAASTPARSWDERRQLGQSLRRLFRRSALHPAALFTWLALELLALERLRAALAIRAAFAPREPA